MKRLSLLFSILLIAWICIASYWYTCKIRNSCGEAAQEATAEMAKTPSEEVQAAEPPATAGPDPGPRQAPQAGSQSPASLPRDSNDSERWQGSWIKVDKGVRNLFLVGPVDGWRTAA